MVQRRNFLRVAGALTTGALLLPHWACQNGTQTAADDAQQTDPASTTTTLTTFGIQLYTLRDVLPQDPRGVLRQLADYGYQQIESYEGEQGIFWGMTNVEFQQYLQELGMQVVASHCDIEKDFERKAAEAAEIGMKYLICPYVGPQESMEDYRKLADTFNERGEVCRKNGIRFAYHNHDYSFVPVDGVYPQDVFMENTDPALVDYEMDMYWVVTAGQDPVTWLEKYPQRFRLSHVKDRMANVPPTETNASCTLGQGSIDYARLLAVAKAQGMEYFVVEQERYEGTTPLQAAEASAAYLRELTLST